MKKQLGILTTLLLVMAIGLLSVKNVESGACNGLSCTPVCGWSFPSSDNYLLADENTTMRAQIEETTTSGFYNGTDWTISPYRNSTTKINTTGNNAAGGLTVEIADLDDGTYKLDATIYYFNETDWDDGTGTYGGGTNNNTQNLTVTSAACTSRYFTIETTEGGLTAIQTAQAQTLVAQETKDYTGTIVALIAVAGVILVIYNKNKK